MTHKEILEQTKAELDRLVSEAKRKLDNLYRPKLELGKWYKDTDEGSNLLVYITDIKADEILGYGFGVSGKWLAPNRKFYSWNIHNAYSFLVEATDQEVETALVKEAKRRGLLYGVNIISPNGEDWGYKVTSNDFRFDQVNNTLYYTYNLGGTVFLFKDGKWAKPVDEGKFAELKEAHKNGATIQFKSKLDEGWHDIDMNEPHWDTSYEYRIKPKDKFAELKEAHRKGKMIQLLIGSCWHDVRSPKWNENFEYRIKPEEKPKVEDVCKFWNDNENKFVISKIRRVYDNGFYTLEDIPYYNAKKVSKQEAIDLLFGK